MGKTTYLVSAPQCVKCSHQSPRRILTPFGRAVLLFCLRCVLLSASSQLDIVPLCLFWPLFPLPEELRWPKYCFVSCLSVYRLCSLLGFCWFRGRHLSVLAIWSFHFMTGVSCGPGCIFLLLHLVKGTQHHLWKTRSELNVYSCVLRQILTERKGVGSVFCSFDLYACSRARTDQAVWTTTALRDSLKSGSVSPPALFLFFQFVEALRVSFVLLHIDFWNICSFSLPLVFQ